MRKFSGGLLFLLLLTFVDLSNFCVLACMFERFYHVHKSLANRYMQTEVAAAAAAAAEQL